MLVLTRKPDQKIRIGNDIVVTVTKVVGDQVSIGIEAPKELKIVRMELVSDKLAKIVADQNRESVLEPKKPLDKDLG